MKKLSAILFFMMLVLSCQSFADEIVSFKGGYLKLNPDGQFAVSSNGLVGTKIDFDDDLGYDDSEEIYLEAALQLGDFRLFASYMPIEFSGEGVLSKDIIFNGETFPVNSVISSDVDIDIYETGLAWHLINLDDLPARIQFGPEIAVKYIDANIDMQESLLGISESESASVPLPSIGLRGRVAFADFVGLIGRATYLEYDDNSFLDLDAQVELSPFPLVGIFAGYRYLDIEVEEDSVFIDGTLDGPYAGALIRF